MKKANHIFILMTLSFVFAASSYAKQVTENDIVGSYSGVDSYSELIAFENNKFVFGSLGTMLRGDWKLDGDFVIFTLVNEEFFRLYGRKLESLSGSSQVRFSFDFKGRDIWANLALQNKRKNKHKRDDLVQRLSGCHSESADSLIHKEDQLIERIILINESPFHPQYTAYDFMIPSGYNDLIAFAPKPSEEVSNLFTAKIEGDKLFNEQIFGADGADKAPLAEINDSDLELLFAIANQGIFPAVLSYSDPYDEDSNATLFSDLYPHIENPNADNTQDFVRISPVVSSQAIDVGDNDLFTLDCSMENQ